MNSINSNYILLCSFIICIWKIWNICICSNYWIFKIILHMLCKFPLQSILNTNLEKFVFLWSNRAGPSRPGSAAKPWRSPINPLTTTSLQWVLTTSHNTNIDFNWSVFLWHGADHGPLWIGLHHEGGGPGGVRCLLAGGPSAPAGIHLDCRFVCLTQITILFCQCKEKNV